VSRLRDLPIRHKLLALGMLGSTLALVASGVAFGVYDWLTFRESLARSLAVQAEILAANCQSAVIFRDDRSAVSTLEALSVEPGILAAAVYTADGARFAAYRREGEPEPPPHARHLPAGFGVRYETERVVVRKPILRDDGAVVGTLVLLSDLAEEGRRLRRYAGIVALVLLGSVAMVYLISSRVQRLISTPILSLADTARVVTESRDFTVRAAPGNRDEVGTLTAAFNTMLGQIQRRDRALQEAREDLERRVEERTAELRRAGDALSGKVAELESTEAELRRLASRLEASNRELQDFASVASHDLQEPLRKIQAFGSRLVSRLGDTLDAESSDYLSRMQNATVRMQALIDDLLALSRVSTQPRAVRQTSLTAVARDVVADLEARIEATGAEIQLDPLPTLPADPTQMRQLFQNLVGNALKFVRPGVVPRVRVWADAVPGEEGVPAWRIAVQDNGIGFEERYLDRIFTVFQRLQGRAAYEGTGIGLAICRRIVERHGGSITARSRPGEGSTFLVTLPARLPEGGHDLERQPEADHHSSGR
jgi:signal transduction histidine kinase